MIKAYTGIGSRNTPDEILNKMTALAKLLAEKNLILRTGHSPGADCAFEAGARQKAVIYLPWKNFNNNQPLLTKHVFSDLDDNAYKLAAAHHPYFFNLKQSSKKLIARNCYQVLGVTLEKPSSFLIYYRSGPGGTDFTVNLAKSYNIKCFDINEVSNQQIIDYAANLK